MVVEDQLARMGVFEVSFARGRSAKLLLGDHSLKRPDRLNYASGRQHRPGRHRAVIARVEAAGVVHGASPVPPDLRRQRRILHGIGHVAHKSERGVAACAGFADDRVVQPVRYDLGLDAAAAVAANADSSL